MNKIQCPTCNTELMEHEASGCMDRWVEREAFGYPEPKGLPISRTLELVWRIMEAVWEMDAKARIAKDCVLLNMHNVAWYVITGSTFPLRVCRAFLYLKAKEQQQ